MTASGRGVLYPARLPTFHRLPAPSAVGDWVRWFWIPEWDVAPGRVSRQHLVGFPAFNLVVEPSVVGLSGPTTRASHRDLTGRGWAVGALLRPAAVRGLLECLGEPVPGDLSGWCDLYRPVAAPGLHRRVSGAMAAPVGQLGDAAESDRDATDPSAERRQRAVDEFTDWLVSELPSPDEEALLANRMFEVIDADSTVLRVEDVAAALAVSVRTVQRLARRYVGFTPAAMIRRRRLQEAAERLREHPDLDIAAVAAELGYSDHAHLSRDFRTVLGLPPSGYRSNAAVTERS